MGIDGKAHSVRCHARSVHSEKARTYLKSLYHIKWQQACIYYILMLFFFNALSPHIHIALCSLTIFV